VTLNQMRLQIAVLSADARADRKTGNCGVLRGKGFTT
jgi:hypothetical protein